MPRPDRDQAIRLVRRTQIDRQARGLASGTAAFYAKKLRYLVVFLEAQGVQDVQHVTPTLLRKYLVHRSSAPDLTTPQRLALDLTHQAPTSARSTFSEFPAIRVPMLPPHGLT